MFRIVRVLNDQVWFGFAPKDAPVDQITFAGFVFRVGGQTVAHGYITQPDIERCERVMARRFTGPAAVRGVIACGIRNKRDVVYEAAAGRLGLHAVAFLGHKGTARDRRDLREAWAETCRLVPA